MYDIVISRLKQDDCTIGRLRTPTMSALTLELPWRDNQQNVSCVTAGVYRYKKHLSPSLGEVVHILDVENRTWIYIHIGNYLYEIKGCILIGTALHESGRHTPMSPSIQNSTEAFRALFASIPDEGTIKIEE